MLFKFFYSVHFSYKLYLITDNLSKSLQKESKKESISAIEGQRIAKLTLKTLQNMCEKPFGSENSLLLMTLRKTRNLPRILRRS